MLLKGLLVVESGVGTVIELPVTILVPILSMLDGVMLDGVRLLKIIRETG
jgi:hypothetical protein